MPERVGSRRSKRLSPKRPSTRFKMKNARKTIISPITAAIIWLRAASTPPLSPPEVIHLIPPHTRKKRAISIATTNITAITNPIMDPSDLPCVAHAAASTPLALFSHGLRLSLFAKACDALTARREAERIVDEMNFFMYYLLLTGLKNVVKHLFIDLF